MNPLVQQLGFFAVLLALAAKVTDPQNPGQWFLVVGGTIVFTVSLFVATAAPPTPPTA